MDLSPLALDAARIAEEAGAEVLNFWTRGQKNDGDRADRTAHEVLVHGLERLEPRLPVVSEEGAMPDFRVRQGWDHFWLIDPIDSTGSFKGGFEDFTVNIALIRDSRPVLGVVHHPVRGHTYYAAAPSGAIYRNAHGGEPRRIRVRSTTDGVVRIVSPWHDDEHRRLRFLRSLKRTGRRCLTSRLSSSFRLCLVAEGAVDVYPGFAVLSEWDTAAGTAVLEAAGGRVLEIGTGEDLPFNQRHMGAQGRFVAYGPAEVPWLDHLRG